MRDPIKRSLYMKIYNKSYREKNSALLKGLDKERKRLYRNEHLMEMRLKGLLNQKRHPESVAIRSARQRCNNKNHPEYKNYGGRGIRCLISVKDLIAHIGKRPSALFSLDRIDNNGSYKVGNLRWATKSQQRINSRGPRYSTH